MSLILCIVLFNPLERYIHGSFYAHLSEAEIQTYAVMISMYVGFLSVGSWILPRMPRIPLLYGKGSGFLLIILGCAAAVLFPVYFLSSVAPDPQFQFHLWEAGFGESNTAPLSSFVFTTVGITGILLLLLPNRTLPRAVSVLLHVSTVLAIFFLTIGINKLNLYDYTHYAGPVHDLLMGRPLLTFRSWYGFFSILVLSIPFRFIPLTVANLHMTFAAIQCIGFILVYILYLRIFKDIRWAITAIIYTIFTNHLTKIGATYEFPQQTFLRMGMWLPFAILIFASQKATGVFKRVLSILMYVTAGIVFFFILDFGTYAIAAYLLYQWVMHMHLPAGQSIRSIGKIFFATVFSVLTVFTGITIMYKIAFGFFPLWLKHYFFISDNFQASTFILRLPEYSVYWIVLILPASLFLSMVSVRLKRQLTVVEQTVLYIASYGMTSFFYFIAESHINAMHALSIPFVLCLFYVLKIVLVDNAFQMRIQRIFSIITIVSLLTIPTTYIFKQGIRNLGYSNIFMTQKMMRSNEMDENAAFGETVKAIRNKYPGIASSGSIAMLSVWDTWYLIMLHSKNIIGSNCLLCYLSNDSFDEFINAASDNQIAVLFVDSDRMIKGDRVARIMDKVSSHYSYSGSVGLLDVYTRNSDASGK